MGYLVAGCRGFLSRWRGSYDGHANDHSSAREEQGYAGLAYLTCEVISGAHGSLSRQQQDITAKVMQHPGGPWLIGVVGLIIVIIGLMLAGEGLRRTFMKYLRTSQMSPGTRRIVRRLGVIGTVARGVVVALVGLLVIDPAGSHAPAGSGRIALAPPTPRHPPP